jgi:dihydrofolate synthase/folylpolyglutamate synthase
MQLDFSGQQLIIVGGTNGKGSTVAMLAGVLQAGGYQVGTYTSPHLLRYNERVCLDGTQASDAELCAAFAAVEAVREDVSLTYFEFGTLAALHFFAMTRPGFVVLEVGLGGRLDAVNIVEPQLSIVTNVALDHMDWLGTTRELIGFEKAGIFRAGRPAIYGESDMPATVREHARRIGAKLLHKGVDYHWQQEFTGWSWTGQSARGEPLHIDQLPVVPFPLDNAAAVVQALQHLQATPSEEQLRRGLAGTTLAGRFQELRYRGRRIILDVAHNPHAAANLAANIRTRLQGVPVHLVLGMLGDKDSKGVVQVLAPVVAHIHAASLAGERGAAAKIIYNHALQIGGPDVTCHGTVQEAFAAACQTARPEAVILVTGSFFTVAAVLELL